MRWLLPLVLTAPLVLIGRAGKAGPTAAKTDAALGECRADFADKAAFDRGRGLFKKRMGEKAGIGPDFNDVSCVACHALPVSGGGGDLAHTAALGPGPEGTEALFFRRHATSGHKPPVPKTAVDRRIPPPLFGLGLLESIPDETIRAGCGSGHVVTVDGRVARFGYKPFVAVIDDFVAQAALTEMGLTSSTKLEYAGVLAKQSRGATVALARPGETIDGDLVADPELDDAKVKDLAAFIRGLRPPPRNGTHPEGEALFKQFGCAGCHHPETAPGVPAFTDLCVHHMGAALDDGITDREAGPDEYRTAPLWGLHLRRLYLHDGRAKTIPQVLEAHGGEATPAAARFKAATEQERKALIAFLQTL